jgi:hypothetical protein
MRARLKNLYSDEILDLASYRPPVPDVFAVPLALEVGPLGLRGRERFDLLVLTPAWLLARHGGRGLVVGHAKLLVFEWSFERIKAFLAKEVEGCTGQTWPDVARQVARLADWEGEGDNVVGLK